MPDTLDSFPDLATSTECNVNECKHTESWVCTHCFKVLCGRYGAQHMIQHKTQNKEHCIAMGCGDLSFWCYACNDYLDHLHMRRVFELYKIAHVRKFKHEIHNLEKLMERTDFAAQDQLEQKLTEANTKKEVPKQWYKGTEMLTRKWTKKDEIEYDSDPQHKANDNKSHIHKGIILKVNPDQGRGKIMIKDDTGGYGNYGLETISIKLPPPTPQNTVERAKTSSNEANDLYTVPAVKRRKQQSKPVVKVNRQYDYSKYRGYDEKDDYVAPIEFVPYEKLRYRKKEWSKGEDIQYDSDPQHVDKSMSHIHKGQLVSMGPELNMIGVKLSTGDDVVQVDLNKVWIGVNKQFWLCRVCGFENGNKTKQCMVCSMNDVEITQQSKRPEAKDKEES
eukprot:206932_1